MNDFLKNIEFIKEVDQLKNIERQTLIMSGGRRENSAEHSWHLALMTMLLTDSFKEELDVKKCMMMAILHDIVEVDAGDVFVYDDKARDEQVEVERKAADRLFGLLPSKLAQKLRKIWNEFEENKTAEARYVKGIDRLQPLLCNYYTEGHSWQKHGIYRDQIDKKNESWISDFKGMDQFVTSMLDECVEKEHLKSR